MSSYSCNCFFQGKEICKIFFELAHAYGAFLQLRRRQVNSFYTARGGGYLTRKGRECKIQTSAPQYDHKMNTTSLCFCAFASNLFEICIRLLALHLCTILYENIETVTKAEFYFRRGANFRKIKITSFLKSAEMRMAKIALPDGFS